MTQWYCCVQEKRYGPVEEETLRHWIREGRILPDNFVWTEEMQDWKRLREMPQFSDVAIPSSSSSSSPSRLERGVVLEWDSPHRGKVFPRLPSSPGGHAGKTRMGKIVGDALGLVPKCLPAILMYVTLTSCLSLLGEQVRAWVVQSLQENAEQFSRSHLELMQWAGRLVPLAVTTLNTVLFFGLSLICLTVVRRQQPSLKQLFRGFCVFPKLIGMAFLITIVIMLWALLLIVPGIIAAMRFTLSYFVLMDHPELGIRKAMTCSEQLMQGQKMRLFLLFVVLYIPSICILYVRHWYVKEYQVTTVPLWLQGIGLFMGGLTAASIQLFKARFYQSALPAGVPLSLPAMELVKNVKGSEEIQDTSIGTEAVLGNLPPNETSNCSGAQPSSGTGLTHEENKG